MPNQSFGINELQPFYRTLPRLEDLNLTQVQNSTVCCRVCRGSTMTATASDVFNSYTFKKCLHCLGTGVMSNNISDYDLR